MYALNDVLDIDKDRAHPIKKNRPIAAGILSPRFAAVMAAVLAAAALAGAVLIDSRFGAVAAGYFLLNVFYSLHIKEIPFLDVMTIAAGFLLRVLGGSFAVDVPPSPWLLACTGLLAAFLGFGKRAHELGVAMAGARGNGNGNGNGNGDGDGDGSGHAVGATRRVLQRYRMSDLRAALWLLGVSTTVAYIFYTLSPHTIRFFGTDRMLWTAPFCAFGIARFLILVTRRARGDSPTEAMLKDWPFMANLALWGGAVLAIIYFG
jgi:4-hydroxybenzoate polyprenyltransferase